MPVTQIAVRRKQVGFGGIVENHAFPRANDIADEGFGTGDPGDSLLAHRDFDLIAGRSRLGLDQIFIPCRQYQKAAIRACVLDRDRHQPLDQAWATRSRWTKPEMP